MKYSILKQLFCDIHEIEISKNQFDELKHARNILLLALTFEEIYEIVISNYAELEKDLLCNSIEFIVKQHTAYVDSFEDRVLINRRLLNVLTSTKLYIDYLSKEEFHLFESNDVQIEKILHKEYDNNKYYRFMETFRNQVQHEELAIYLTQYNAETKSESETNQHEYTFNFYTKKSRLIKNKRLLFGSKYPTSY